MTEEISRDDIERDLREAAGARHRAVQDITRWFTFSHLPAGTPRDVSALTADLAVTVLKTIPADDPELTRGLSSLLAAKDSLVRAAIAAQGGSGEAAGAAAAVPVSDGDRAAWLDGRLAAVREDRDAIAAERDQLAEQLAAIARPDAGVQQTLDPWAAVTAERDKLQQACQTLGMVVERQARDLYAMWIDVSRGDMAAVRERVLNTIPDVDDNEPDEQWNGTETGSEWFWRTAPEREPGQP